MYGLDQKADVYAAATTTGRYTVKIQQGLACRFTSIPTISRLQRQSDGRAELAGMKILLFDPDYAMPEGCQLEDEDKTRWQPVPGSFSLYRDWNGTKVYRRCDVLRQQVTQF